MIVNRTTTKYLLLQQAGKKEGGLEEGIFARLLTAPKARLGWERVRSLAPLRKVKQNIFQFLLEEKRSRAKIEKREKCFAWRRRQAGGAAGRGLRPSEHRLSLKKGSREVYNYSTKTNLVGIDCSARRVRRAPQSKIRLCFCRKIPEFAPLTI